MATIHDPFLFHATGFAIRTYCEHEVDAAVMSAESQRIRAVYVDEFGDASEVSVKSLRTSSPFVRALMGSCGLWSMSALEQVIDAGKRIKERHKEAQTSLDAILSSPRKPGHPRLLSPRRVTRRPSA